MLPVDKKIELPWALEVRRDPHLPNGVRYFYYRTKAEAEKSRRIAVAKNHPVGNVEHRPGEAWALGWA